MSTYHIITYGCQMNENDSEKLAGLLERDGYTYEEIPEKANILVLNTCSVRENADDRFFGNLGNLKIIKKQRSDFLIAVCGCMMQQEQIVSKLKAKYPFVDIVFGTHNIEKFPQLIRSYLSERKQLVEILSDKNGIVEIDAVKRKFTHKAYVSITFGCDNFCTYCIVPYTRGREISRKDEDILNEVQTAVTIGAKEIMLLGQNVNSYNKKEEGGCSFAQLLKKVNDIEGVRRVRFMTSHPKDFTDDIISAIAGSEKVCHSIHLPLQSGSDRVLKEMNRHYDSSYYIALVKKIRAAIPDITISTDIIVGFPTETEEDFEKTLYAVEECGFDAAFTFIYSPRSGTKAANMPRCATNEEIHERFDRLLSLQHGIMRQKSEAYVGTIQELLVDGTSKGDIQMQSGRTTTNKLVNFKGNCFAGDIVNVKITQNNTFYLSGELI